MSLCLRLDYNWKVPTRIFQELPLPEREDGRFNWQSQDFGAEAYLSSAPQGPTPEDASKDDQIRGGSK